MFTHSCIIFQVHISLGKSANINFDISVLVITISLPADSPYN